MDIRKFGAYISKLRKEKDLTQSQLADMLNVTRQAVSKWEMGDSFPDISLLQLLSSLLNVTLDQLLSYGKPCGNENRIMLEVAKGTPERVADMLESNELPIEPVVNIAHILKASTLDTISKGLSKHGIDITHIIELAEYMNETGVACLLKKASYEKLDEEMLARFIPFLNHESKEIILSKVIEKELSSSLLEVMIPYLDEPEYYQIYAAVLDGQIDADILKILHKMHESG